MFTWWFLWMMVMFLFLVPSVSYGWGYRSWGPPYPRYIQRRRAARQAPGSGDDTSFDHQAWGWRGDLVWIVFGAFYIAIFWALIASWSSWSTWRR